MKKRKVILVTDGDNVAKKAVEIATNKIGGRCISRSAGNPTPRTGKEIITLIKDAKYDPVVVMVDDRGHQGEGKGEQAIRDIANSDEIDILGIIAVASNTEGVIGAHVDFSINNNGQIVNASVDKRGNSISGNIVYGDTVDIVDSINSPVVVGIGDPGKMGGRDNCEIGAPIITRAMEEIIKRSSL